MWTRNPEFAAQASGAKVRRRLSLAISGYLWLGSGDPCGGCVWMLGIKVSQIGSMRFTGASEQGEPVGYAMHYLPH